MGAWFIRYHSWYCRWSKFNTNNFILLISSSFSRFYSLASSFIDLFTKFSFNNFYLKSYLFRVSFVSFFHFFFLLVPFVHIHHLLILIQLLVPLLYYLLFDYCFLCYCILVSFWFDSSIYYSSWFINYFNSIIIWRRIIFPFCSSPSWLFRISTC